MSTKEVDEQMLNVHVGLVLRIAIACVMMRGVSALVFLALIAGAAGEAVNLNKANFDAEVFGSGKNAFVKFLAPW